MKRYEVHSIIFKDKGKVKVVGKLLLDFSASSATVVMAFPRKPDALFRFHCGSLKEVHAEIAGRAAALEEAVKENVT